MKHILKTLVLSIFFFLLAATPTLAISNYGDGTFGTGDFNLGENINDTPTNPTPPSNNPGPPDPSCHDASPVGTPDLFQVNTTKTSATLSFSPPPMPYTGFYIAYSSKKTVWEYGTEYSQGYSGGILKFTINKLKPNTTYYFQLRAGNGCNGGGHWSNVMTAKTTQNNSSKVFYKNFTSRLTQPVKTLVNKITAKIAPVTQSKPIKQDQPVTVNTPMPTSVTVPTNPPRPTPSPTKKFCLLWWCF